MLYAVFVSDHGQDARKEGPRREVDGQDPRTRLHRSPIGPALGNERTRAERNRRRHITQNGAYVYTVSLTHYTRVRCISNTARRFYQTRNMRRSCWPINLLRHVHAPF